MVLTLDELAELQAGCVACHQDDYDGTNDPAHMAAGFPTDCMACHTTTGHKLVGPTFKDMYGFEFDTVEGTRITVDDAYIRESILTPNVSVIAGYQPVMTPFAGLVTDQEIEAITAWLKTLFSKRLRPVRVTISSVFPTWPVKWSVNGE